MNFDFRKAQLAENHSRTSLLRKYFIAWNIWARGEQERRELEQAQNNTRNKMMSLLEAAATGKLWQGREDDLETERSRASSRVQENNSARASRDKKSTAEKIVSKLLFIEHHHEKNRFFCMRKDVGAEQIYSKVIACLTAPLFSLLKQWNPSS